MKSFFRILAARKLEREQKQSTIVLLSLQFPRGQNAGNALRTETFVTQANSEGFRIHVPFSRESVGVLGSAGRGSE